MITRLLWHAAETLQVRFVDVEELRSGLEDEELVLIALALMHYTNDLKDVLEQAGVE